MKFHNKFRDYISGQFSGHKDSFEKSQENIITSLKNGYSLHDSIKKFDYDESKIRRWYNEGSKGDSGYYDFYKACDTFVADEIKNHDFQVIYNKLKDAKSFSNAIGEGYFNSDTYNSPELIKRWIISGKNGHPEFKELYSFVRQFAFQDLLDLDIDFIISTVNSGAPNLDFLNSDDMYCRKDDFCRWYRSIDHNDKNYIKLNSSCGEFFKRVSKDYFLYKLDKGSLLGDSFQTDFHNFIDFINWYNGGFRGDSEDVLFYKNARSKLVEIYNFDEHNNAIFDKLKPNMPFDDALGNISRVSVNQWIELGKYGLEPFHSFYNEYLKHNAQFNIIHYLEQGYEFDNQIPNLDFDFEVVQSWFDEKGDFYKCCINTFIQYTGFKDAKSFLYGLNPDVSLNDAIDNSKIPRKNIERWMEYGKKGYEPFSKFNGALIKSFLIKAINNNLSFDHAFNLFDAYYSFEEFKHEYNNDEKFRNKLSELLIKNTNFDKAEMFLNDFNFEISMDENLANSNIDNEELNQWFDLSNHSIQPFTDFHDEFNKLFVQNNIVLAIKEGSSFERAFNVDSDIFSDEEIRSWYDSGEGKFYETCYKLTENETQYVIISYLSQGLTFDDAINQPNIIHNQEDIKLWFIKGENGDENYADFYNNVGNTIMISQLKQGLYLNQAISAGNGLIDLDYVKNRYKHDHLFYDEINELLVKNTSYGNFKDILNYLDYPLPPNVIEWIYLAANDFDPFKVFYEEYKKLIYNIQDVVINSLDNNMSIEEIMQLKEVNCSVNVLKSWYDKGANEDSSFRKFHNSIKSYLDNLIEIKQSRNNDSPDFKDKNKIEATLKVVIDNMYNGMSFEEAINIYYLYYDSEAIEKFYYEGFITNNFTELSNEIYKFIKNNNSRIKIKSSVFLRMKEGFRFKDLANHRDFKHHFNNIQRWYAQGLNGNKEHNVFASIVKDYDESIKRWRKSKDKKIQEDVKETKLVFGKHTGDKQSNSNKEELKENKSSNLEFKKFKDTENNLIKQSSDEEKKKLHKDSEIKELEEERNKIKN